MKKILAVLLSVVLLSSCVVFVGCTEKEEIAVMISCSYDPRETSWQDSVRFVYDAETDVHHVFFKNKIERRIYVSGYKLNRDVSYSDAWSELDLSCLELSGTYQYNEHQGTEKIEPMVVGPNKEVFIIEAAGTYVLKFKINPNDHDLQSRTLTLVVNVYYMDDIE